MNKRKRHLLIGGASILLGITLPYIFDGDFIDFLSGAFIGAGLAVTFFAFINQSIF